jgi:hypothetical protein
MTRSPSRSSAPRVRSSRVPVFATFATFAMAAAFATLAGCAAEAASGGSADAAAPSNGQGVCDASARSGLCIAYPFDRSAQATACAQASGTYRAPSVCMPASRVGTCACEDIGNGLGAATLSLYAPTFTCASAKQACAQACNGRAGTFNGGC